MTITRLPDDAQIEREWQAQEHALAQEHRRADAATDDPHVRRYRLLARVLAEEPAAALPADFARRVAAHARRTIGPAIDARFERRLLPAMFAAFGIAVVAVVASYGGEWLPTLSGLADTGDALGGHWALALLACVGVSAMISRVDPARVR